MGEDCRGRSTNPGVHWGVMCCLLLSNLQGPPIPAKAGSLGIRVLWEGEAAPRKCWGCVPEATVLHKLQTPLTRVELYSPQSSPTTIPTDSHTPLENGC